MPPLPPAKPLPPLPQNKPAFPPLHVPVKQAPSYWV